MQGERKMEQSEVMELNEALDEAVKEANEAAKEADEAAKVAEKTLDKAKKSEKLSNFAFGFTMFTQLLLIFMKLIFRQ